MDRQISADKFFLLIQAYPDQRFDAAIDDQPTSHRDRDAHQRADELRHEADAAKASQRLAAKDTAAEPDRRV